MTVQLDDVAPDGTLSELGKGTHQVSVQNLLPYRDVYDLDAAGAHLGKGHSLRLLITAEDVDVLTWLQYDSTSAPANVLISSSVLDSDRDGIPDDVDACVTEADCDHDATIDGNEYVWINNTTVYNPSANSTGGQDDNNGNDGNDGNDGGAGLGTPETVYQYYYNWPAEPMGSGTPDLNNGGASSGPRATNVELLAGAGMAAASLLVSLGGLFGRHPL